MLTFASVKRGGVRARQGTPQSVPSPIVRETRPQIRRILQTPQIQPKLTVGPPDDEFEHEADRVADQVMRMPDPAAASATPRIQRMCKECEEEEHVQRMCRECEAEKTNLQRSPAGAAGALLVPDVPRQLESGIRSLEADGQPLTESARAFFQPRLGVDLSGVRLHSDATAASMARAVKARAFTLGPHVAFAEGEYRPETSQGRRLLAHELTHVIQQGEGRQPSELSPTLHRQPAVAPPPAPAAPLAPAAPAAAPAAAAPAGPAPTSDPLLNEWLAEHPDGHLSSDLAWILAQWPTGGSINDLEADFRDDIRGLLDFVAATPGTSFSIISFARENDKQHVMHVGQYIRKGWVGYNAYKLSLWPGIVAAGGRAAILGKPADDRKTTLQGVANPEVLEIVWDTGTHASSTTDGSAVAAAYHIGANNPVANGGATYAWPTDQTTESRHGTGKAVDAEPVALPNEVTIRSNEARAWPDLAAAQAAFGAANVAEVAATDTEPAGYKISGLTNVGRRDAFFDLFFEVRSAARAGFVDLQHFQAP